MRVVVVLVLLAAVLYGTVVVWIATHDLVEYPWNQSDNVLIVLAGLGVVVGFVWALVAVRRGGIAPAFLGGGILGVATTMLALLFLPVVQLANAKWDSHPPQVVGALVTGTEVQRRQSLRGSSVVYRLSITTPLEEPTSRTITVKHAMWSSVRKGDRAVVMVGQGLFGWRYVAAVEKLPPAKSDTTLGGGEDTLGAALLAPNVSIQSGPVQAPAADFRR